MRESKQVDDEKHGRNVTSSVNLFCHISRVALRCHDSHEERVPGYELRDGDAALSCSRPSLSGSGRSVELSDRSLAAAAAHDLRSLASTSVGLLLCFSVLPDLIAQLKCRCMFQGLKFYMYSMMYM